MKSRQAASPSPIMTTAEIAQFLRVHRSTIYRLLREHRIPVFKVGSDYRFDKDAVAKWMADESK
jgi:excisionase family DNA binding protein